MRLGRSARFVEFDSRNEEGHDHRLRLMESAPQRGLTLTARLFQTVRKPCSSSGDVINNRVHADCWMQPAPHRLPQKTPPQNGQQVLALRRQLPTFGAARLKREFDLPVSHMAIQRIWCVHDS